MKVETITVTGKRATKRYMEVGRQYSRLIKRWANTEHFHYNDPETQDLVCVVKEKGIGTHNRTIMIRRIPSVLKADGMERQYDEYKVFHYGE